MISVEEALAHVLALADRVPEETVPLALASGRAMTRPALAGRDQPPVAAAALDGYALAGPARPGDRGTVIGMAAAAMRALLD
ncbi:MAG: molybdopterin molybdenumtransferase MoeA, partial [Rhodobacterales bacterium]